MSKIVDWLHERAAAVEASPFGNVASAALHDAADAWDALFPDATPLDGPPAG